MAEAKHASSGRHVEISTNAPEICPITPCVLPDALDREDNSSREVVDKAAAQLPEQMSSGNIWPDRSTGTSLSSHSLAISASRSEASYSASSYRVDESLLPPELAFLASDACNPDIRRSKAAQKQGCVTRPGVFKRSKSSSFLRIGSVQMVQQKAAASLQAAKNVAKVGTEKREETLLHDGKFYRWRRCFGSFILSTRVQSFVILTIIFDCVVTILGIVNDVNKKDDPTVNSLSLAADVLVIIVFSLDIIGRWMFMGCCSYWRGKMNCFEFLILVVSIVDVILARLDMTSLAVLRFTRPIMRFFRFVRLFVRIFQRGRFYLVVLRHAVSGNRMRFQEDNFDLDLAYITGNIIAMSTPGSGYASIFHNPVNEVASFMNERHPNKYLILNTTEEQRYSTSPFFHRCIQFPIPPNGVPTLEGLLRLCRIVQEYLDAAEGHVVAVHSKHNQGRVGLVVAALLLYRKDFDTVPAAINFLENQRTDPESAHQQHDSSTQSIDSVSQERFLEYFTLRCRFPEGEDIPAPRKVMLRRIRLYGCPDTSSLDICCFAHPGSEAEATNSEFNFGYDDTPMQHFEAMHATESSRIGALNSEQTNHTMLGLPNRVIQSKIKQLKEECEFDSYKAGSFPLRGTPLFTSSTTEGGMEHKKVKRIFETGRSEEKGLKDGQVAIWEFVDTELSGEIRFEVHRAKDSGVAAAVARNLDKIGAKGAAVGGVSRLQQLINFFARRPVQAEKAKTISSGMLFCCWLHASFLEMDEQKNRSFLHSTADEHLVNVVLQRFDLDKAVYAPRLTSGYTSALKLHLEFWVEEKSPMFRGHDIEESPNGPSGFGSATGSAINTKAEVSGEYSLAWLNFIMHRLWPRMHESLALLLKESIEPAIQELPAPLNNLSFTVFSFGDASKEPQLGPISVCSRVQEGLEELQMDIAVRIESDVDVQVSAAGLGGLLGMNHLKLHGLLSVKLKPIVEQLPVIEGVQFVFLNMPDMNLNFTGNLASAANLSMIKKVIMDAIHQSLLDIIVMPNMVVLNYSASAMEAGDMMCTFQDVLPHAVLRLGVIQATKIEVATMSTADFVCGRKLPDPYATVDMAAQNVHTAVAEETVSPFWAEEFDMLLYDEGQHLDISVKDGGAHALRDDLLAEVKEKVPAARVIEAGPEGLWLNLVGPTGDKRGKICVTATVLDLRDDLDEIRQDILALEAKYAAEESKPRPRRKSIVSIARHSPQVSNNLAQSEGVVPYSRSRPEAEGEPKSPKTPIDEASGVASGASSDAPSVAGVASGVASAGSSDAPSVCGTWQDSTGLRSMGDFVGRTGQAVGWCFDQSLQVAAGAGSAAMAGINATAEHLDGATSRRGASAVGVLVCRVHGGLMNSCPPHLVDIRVRIGRASSPLRRCMEAIHAEMPNVTDDLHTVIRRLAMTPGWDKIKIADVVDKSPEVVLKIMRKQLQWNMDLPHRLCVPVKIDDLVKATELKHIAFRSDGSEDRSNEKTAVSGMVEVSVLYKNRVVGSCCIDFKNVTKQPKGKAYRGEHFLTKDAATAATLDLELRLYSLKSRVSEEQERVTANREDPAESILVNSTSSANTKSALRRDKNAASSTSESSGTASRRAVNFNEKEVTEEAQVELSEVPYQRRSVSI